MMRPCPKDRCFICGCTPSHAICESCADGLDEIAGDRTTWGDTGAAQVRAVLEAELCTDKKPPLGVDDDGDAYQAWLDRLSVKIARLSLNDEEVEAQRDEELDDAEDDAIIERMAREHPEQVPPVPLPRCRYCEGETDHRGICLGGCVAHPDGPVGLEAWRASVESGKPTEGDTPDDDAKD